MKYDTKELKTDSITLTKGKKYLYEIVDRYTTKDIREDMHKETDCFVNTISNKEELHRFRLDPKLYEVLSSLEDMEALAYDLRNAEEDFCYGGLFYNFQKYYEYFLEDVSKKEPKVHLWFELSPQQPDNTNPLGDVLPNYDSIMCEFKLKSYVKHTDRERTSTEGWAYQLSLFYLIIIDKLYRLLEPYIDNILEFLETCFWVLNPTVVGFTVTIDYDLGSNVATWIVNSLMQLHSSGKHLTIKQEQKEFSVEFKYCLLNNTFHSGFETPEQPQYEHDNNGDRLVKLRITGHGSILTLRIDTRGLNSIKDLTDYPANKTLYAFMDDLNFFDMVAYRVLSVMLSHTKEHKQLYNKVRKAVIKRYNNGEFFNLWKEPEDVFKKKTIANQTKNYVYDHVFNDIKTYDLSTITNILRTEFQLQDNALDYTIIAVEFSDYSNKDISTLIKHLGSNQQSKIRKMIKYVRAIKEYVNTFKCTPLNLLYRKVSYKCL